MSNPNSPTPTPISVPATTCPSTSNPPSIPPTMHAWSHILTGSPSTVLTLSTSFPTPTLPSPTSVLIKVSHCALNPGGSIMISLAPSFLRKKPTVPELDFSGTVVSVGASVPSTRPDLTPGSSVFGSVHIASMMKTGGGALAEYVAIEAERVVKVPEGMGMEEAAGLGVAGCTALELVDKAKLEEGTRVLVNGASGGIGVLVVQMVRQRIGKTGVIVAVCSGANAEMVRGLGADEVIDYKTHSPVTTHLAETYSSQPFTSIIDAIGIQPLYTSSPLYLAPSRPFISVGVMIETLSYASMLSSVLCLLKNNLLPRWLGGVDRDYVLINVVAAREGMERLRGLVEEGVLRGVVDGCWDFEDALGAYERMVSHRARGKVVIRI